MPAVASCKVELILERPYAGSLEFIGLYSIQNRQRTPFRIVGDKNLKEMQFEPELLDNHRIYDEYIKSQVLQQSTSLK